MVEVSSFMVVLVIVVVEDIFGNASGGIFRIGDGDSSSVCVCLSGDVVVFLAAAVVVVVGGRGGVRGEGRYYCIWVDDEREKGSHF